MDYNNISGCITTIENDSIKIDDSKFPIFALPLDGEEYNDTGLGVLVCATET